MKKLLEDMTEPELRDLMNAICRGIEATAAEHLAERPLFAIVLFNATAGSLYAANCQRADIIKSMRETEAGKQVFEHYCDECLEEGR